MITGADLIERAAELRRQGVAFALATVVRSRRPASARPGDRALILADGALVGWVGGSCAQDSIRREALRALAEGRPRLVRLSPEAGPSDDEEGVVRYPMTCHSGGTLEIYVEPFTPPPRLVVLGDSPVARALAALGPPLGFAVTASADPTAPLPADLSGDTWVVIAAMGDRDELATEAALRRGAHYVALVASRVRATAVVALLRERGLGEAALARLKAPAGLDIGAMTGAEVALSILAEIVQRRRAAPPAPAAEIAAPPATARDPVCGMEVEIATARWTSEHTGQTLYFCAPGCKRQFDRDPAAYLPSASGG